MLVTSLAQRLRRSLSIGRVLACPLSRLARLAFAGLLATAGAAAVAASVDVNTATREELQAIKGIGPAMSQRIVEERERGGPFRSPQDLDRRVKGIGETSLKKMRESGLVVGRGGPNKDARQGRVEDRPSTGPGERRGRDAAEPGERKGPPAGAPGERRGQGEAAPGERRGRNAEPGEPRGPARP